MFGFCNLTQKITEISLDSQCDNITSKIITLFCLQFLFAMQLSLWRLNAFQFSSFIFCFPIAELERIVLSSNAFSGTFLLYGFLLCPYTFIFHTHHIVYQCRLHKNNSCTKWNCFRIANNKPADVPLEECKRREIILCVMIRAQCSLHRFCRLHSKCISLYVDFSSLCHTCAMCECILVSFPLPQHNSFISFSFFRWIHLFTSFLAMCTNIFYSQDWVDDILSTYDFSTIKQYSRTTNTLEQLYIVNSDF